ncbi:hypothetical protein V8G54_007801 [Vigna mungo]|uniref:Uncharacterized protein n=1 Tax=Vigna mungo TaxID=3915 RepID=A0AAQ3S9F2_VIGMU
MPRVFKSSTSSVSAAAGCCRNRRKYMRGGDNAAEHLLAKGDPSNSNGASKGKGKNPESGIQKHLNPDPHRLKNQRVLEAKLENKQYQITNRFTFKCLCGKKICSNFKIQCSYFQLRLESSVYKLMCPKK